MKRRGFLRGAAVLAAGAGGGAATLLGEKEAAAFGETPKGAEASAVPANLRAQNILEIFLYGGVSQYESFYCVDAFGQSDGSGWWTFFNNGEVQKAVAQCGYTGPLLQDFAKDSDGNQVKNTQPGVSLWRLTFSTTRPRRPGTFAWSTAGFCRPTAASATTRTERTRTPYSGSIKSTPEDPTRGLRVSVWDLDSGAASLTVTKK